MNDPDADGEPVVVRWMNYRFWPATLEQMMSDRLSDEPPTSDYPSGTLIPAREIDDKTGWLPVWFTPDGVKVLGMNTGDRDQLWERQIAPTEAKPAQAPDAEPGKPLRPVRAP